MNSRGPKNERNVMSRGSAMMRSMFRFPLVTRFLVACRTAFDALMRNPMRGALTGFGILVGVAAVTIVITLGEGAEKAVQAQIASMGENLITIRAQSTNKSGAGKETLPLLTEMDAAAISEHVPGIEAIAPAVEGLARAVAQNRNAAAQVVGITSGALWDETQESTSARVALIGPTVQEELFPGENPVGKTLRIGRHLFRILGVLDAKGQTPFGTDQDNVVVMPLGTMRSKISPTRPFEIQQIMLTTKEGTSTEVAERPIRALLRQRHHLQSEEEDDFSVRDQSRMASAQRGVVMVMRLLLLSIAGVSLVIGGIGVMNIMLVSVAERSKEIGTRLAVGARGSDILTQFLIEAVFLSALGGSLGVVAAGAVVSPLEAYFGWTLEVSARSLVIATVVSITIGVVFGLLPARRAARLDPVEALRRE
jgi:putative ABC transport system permease protein